MSMILYLRRVEDVAALWEKAAEPEEFFEFLDSPESTGDLVDLDKGWQVIHFVLTGSWENKGPLAFLLHAGVPIGEDPGYGPVRLAAPAEVRSFRDAFATLNDAELRRRYEPAAMAAQNVYLADTLADEGEDGWAYVMQSIPALRKLLDRSVETGSAIAIWVM